MAMKNVSWDRVHFGRLPDDSLEEEGYLYSAHYGLCEMPVSGMVTVRM